MSKRTYSADELKSAIATFKRSKLSLAKVASDFGIPRTTLSDHIHGKSDLDVDKRPYILNEEEDRALVNYMKYLAEQGFPMTRAIVRTYIKAMYKENERTPLFNIGLISLFNQTTFPNYFLNEERTCYLSY